MSSGCSHCPSWSPVPCDFLEWWQYPVADSTASIYPGTWHGVGAVREIIPKHFMLESYMSQLVYSAIPKSWYLWVLVSIHSHLTWGVSWCPVWENGFLCIQFLCSTCFASVVELQKINFFRYLNEKMGKWCLIWIRSVLIFIVLWLSWSGPSCNFWFPEWITTFCVVWAVLLPSCVWLAWHMSTERVWMCDYRTCKRKTLKGNS